jgi:hypothetical protein
MINYSETSELNANIRFGSESSAERNRIFKRFCHFLKILIIRFELATYSNEPLDSMYFKTNEALNSS